QHFPWNRLPKELRVKILQNLSRSDLDKCRLLNRETSELVRSNERWMKRRQIEYLKCLPMERSCPDSRALDARFVGVLYIEEGELKSVVRHLKTFTMVPSYLSRLLKKSNVHHLEIAKVVDRKTMSFPKIRTIIPSKLQGPWTDSHLSSILSSLLETDCHVHRLMVTKASMATVTSSMLLLFLQELDPIEICFSQVRDCSRDNFSPEVLTSFFSVTCLQGELIPIDDEILAKLTASTFVIGAPNMITVDGLVSFIK
ncbi:F-box domain protein, partial [Ostertagia ostertagi]